MPTVFENINHLLDEVNLDAELGNKVNDLLAIGQLFEQLIQNPPTELEDLIEALKNIELPQIGGVNAIGNTLESLQGILPDESIDFAKDLLTKIEEVATTIQSRLKEPLEQMFCIYEEIRNLFRLVAGIDIGDAPNVLNPSAPSPSTLTNNNVLAASPLATNSLGTQLTNGLNQFETTLAALPEPLNLDKLLEFIKDLLSNLRRDVFPVKEIPFIDEMLQLLDTIYRWKAASGNQLISEIDATLQQLADLIAQNQDDVLSTIADLLSDLSNSIDFSLIQSTINQINAALVTLANAIQNSDLAAIHSAIDTIENLKTNLDTLLQSLSTDFLEKDGSELATRLNRLPTDMKAKMLELLSLISPTNPLPESLLPNLFANVDLEEGIQQIGNLFNGPLQSIQEVVDNIDLSVLENLTAPVNNTIQEGIDSMDDLLIEVTTQVNILFNDIETTIDQVDTAAINTQIEVALEEYKGFLQDQIDALLGPIRNVIESAIQEIDTATDQFKPEDLINILRDALQHISGFLNGPEVKGVIDRIKQTIDTATKELEKFSYKPVNDLVIDQINSVGNTLEKVETSEMGDVAKFALAAAIEVLKAIDLDDLKNSLTNRYKGLIEEGPITLVEQVKKQPEKIKNQISRISPEQLIGHQLSAPFNTLLAQVEGFQSSTLLAPLESSLAELKTSLNANTNPAQFLESLVDLFDTALAIFDKANPSHLVGRLQEKIDQVVADLIAVLPVDSFFDLLAEVLDCLQQEVDKFKDLRQILQAMINKLAALDDVEQQAEAWIEGLLQKLDTLPTNFNLQDRLDQIQEAVNQNRATPLRNRFEPALDNLIQSIDTISPGQLLTDLIRQFRDIPRNAVEGLPLAERNRVMNLLDSFDPLDATISGPLNDLDTFLNQLQSFRAPINEIFSSWDDWYHGPNSPFRQNLPQSLDLTALRDLIKTSLEEQLGRSINLLAALLRPSIDSIRTIFENLDQFTNALETKTTALLNGPLSLSTIRDQMQAIIDKINDFNLSFLSDELNAVFQQIKNKLLAISPANLKTQIDDLFTGALDELDLSNLIPDNVFETVDTEIQQIIDKLKLLDPEKIVTEVLQPEFLALVQPFIDAFDLSNLFNALLEVLDRLKEELETELKRTCQAFDEMLDKAPSLSSLSIGVDIGIDIGF